MQERKQRGFEETQLPCSFLHILSSLLEHRQPLARHPGARRLEGQDSICAINPRRPRKGPTELQNEDKVKRVRHRSLRAKQILKESRTFKP